MKKHLQNLQKILPNTWIEKLQYIHSSLLSRWILSNKSQSLEFNQKSAIVFSPHQDDETFGCGGAIALKREYGTPVAVAFLTDGQGGGNSEPIFPEKIIQIRKEEAIKALKILGVETSAIHFLDKPDGTLPDLNPEEKQQTIAGVVALLKHYQPEEVYVPHYKDCHRDHEATYKLVKEAIAQAEITVEIIQYPIWLFWRSPLFIMLKWRDITAARHLSIASVKNKKSRAIFSYSSQITSLPSGFIKQFLGTNEVFFKTKSS